MYFTDLLLKSIAKWRDAVCLGMYLFGAPIVYFVRDGLGVATGSSLFTFVFLYGPLLFLLPFKSLKTFYLPNTKSYFLAFLFIFISALYLYAYAPNSGWFTNTSYETIILGVNIYLLIALTTVSAASMDPRFVKAVFFICLIGCLLLMLYLFTASYTFGTRASIHLGGDSGSDNPHIFAKAGYAGLVAALIYLKYNLQKSYLDKLIVQFGILLFIVVIIITQTMSTIFATFIMLFLYFLNNFSLRRIRNGFLSLITKWYFWVGLAYVIYKLPRFIAEKGPIIALFWQLIYMRLEKLVRTVFLGNDEASEIDRVLNTDLSSASRMEHIQEVSDAFLQNAKDGDLWRLLFGNGFQQLYVDVPILEPLHSYGVFGFMVFLTFFIYISRESYREMRRPETALTEFIAYTFVYYFVFTFTGGLVMDFPRWGFYAVVCRFLPLSLVAIPAFNLKTN